MIRPLLAALVLVTVAGCTEARLSRHETARAAAVADSLGNVSEAVALYRDAARRGDVWAQMRLGDLGRERHSLGDWLFEPRPTLREAAQWAETARRTATERAAAGDADGHLALANLIAFEAQDLDEPAAADSYAVAKRHLDSAVALGNRQAILTRAFIMWQADGSLAAEPFFREAARAGFPQAVGMLSHIAYARPLLEQGLHARDAGGDLSRVDVVGSIRVLQTSGLAEPRADAAEKIEALRVQARAGSAEADSLLRALADRDARA